MSRGQFWEVCSLSGQCMVVDYTRTVWKNRYAEHEVHVNGNTNKDNMKK